VVAFLTGLLRVTPGDSKTTVVIEAFDRKRPKPHKVVEFTFAADRSLLAEMGQRFALTKRALNTVEEKLDEQANQEAFGAKDKKMENQPAVNLDRLVKFEIFYDGKPVPIGPDDLVKPPRPGQRVYFQLTSSEKIGVVLRVNGINTNGYEKELPEVTDYSYWVLEPGKAYRILGFYPEPNKVKRFEVVAPRKVNFAALGDERKLGHIDLDYLRALPEAKAAEEDKNLRPLSLKEVPEAAPTLEKLQGKIRSTAQRKLRPRGVILAGESDETPEIQEVPFRGRWAGHRTIIYYHPTPGKDEGP